MMKIKVYNKDGKVSITKINTSEVEQALFSDLENGEVAVIEINSSHQSISAKKEQVVKRRKSLYHTETGTIWDYYDSVGNPCECGSNCFHFEHDLDTGKVYGVCNSCNTDIYQPSEEYAAELLQRGSWY